MQNIWIIIVALSVYDSGYKNPPAIHQATSDNFMNEEACQKHLTTEFFDKLEKRNDIQYEIKEFNSFSKVILSSHKGYDNKPMQLVYKCLQVSKQKKPN